MANKSISQLTSGNPAQNTDLIPIARAGANFSITPQSIAALAGGNIPASSGVMIVGPFMNYQFLVANQFLPVGSASNQVRVTKIVTQIDIYLTKCTFNVNSGGGSSNTNFSFGFYNHAGTVREIYSGVQNVNSNIIFTLTFASVKLPAGVHYFAQTGDSVSPNLWGIPASSLSSATTAQLNANDVWF